MRCYRATLLALLVALAVPGGVRAQEAGRGAHRTTVVPFIGLGGGPSPSGAIGLGVSRSVAPHLALGLEGARWSSGLAACADEWPRSYSCSVGGWSALGVVRLSTSRSPGEGVALDGVAGAFRHSDHLAADRMVAALGGGVSYATLLSDHWGVRLGARYLRMHDVEYRRLLGTGLHYVVGLAGVQYRLGR